MKNLVTFASVAALALAVGTTQAISFDYTVGLSSTVEPLCSFTGDPIFNGANQTGENTASVSVGNKDGIVDEGQVFNIQFNGLSCNSGQVSVNLASANSGLTSSGTDKIDYIAGARLGSADAFVTIDTTSLSSNSGTVDLDNTTLNIDISIQDDATPLSAGTYTDTLTINVDAAT